jgi:hypothetical protein
MTPWLLYRIIIPHLSAYLAQSAEPRFAHENALLIDDLEVSTELDPSAIF